MIRLTLMDFSYQKTIVLWFSTKLIKPFLINIWLLAISNYKQTLLSVNHSRLFKLMCQIHGICCHCWSLNQCLMCNNWAMSNNLITFIMKIRIAYFRLFLGRGFHIIFGMLPLLVGLLLLFNSSAIFIFLYDFWTIQILLRFPCIIFPVKEHNCLLHK